MRRSPEICYSVAGSRSTSSTRLWRSRSRRGSLKSPNASPQYTWLGVTTGPEFTQSCPFRRQSMDRFEPLGTHIETEARISSANARFEERLFQSVVEAICQLDRISPTACLRCRQTSVSDHEEPRDSDHFVLPEGFFSNCGERLRSSVLRCVGSFLRRLERFQRDDTVGQPWSRRRRSLQRRCSIGQMACSSLR